MGPANRKDWREICEEVLRTHDPNRVNALLEELLEALEERARNRDRMNPTSSDS